MSNIVPFQDMQGMAAAIAKSGLFGMKSVEQALALMLVAQAEGMHPASVTQDYDIIQGRAARKTHSVLARFQQAGGQVQWHELTDSIADATFSHKSGGSLRMTWTFEQAKKAGLTGKDNWRNYPRAMLRARCIAEGIRAVYPAALGGMMVSEEVQDLQQQVEITKSINPATGEIETASPELMAQAEKAAKQGVEAYRKFWKESTPETRRKIGGEQHTRLKRLAEQSEAVTDVQEKVFPVAEENIPFTEAIQ